jgi:vacuolar-type H+-ATPase subunit E/Vma4
MMAAVIGSGLDTYIHRQTRERALNLIAEAREKANLTLQEAQAEIETMRSQRLAALATELAEKKRRAVAQAGLQAQHALIRQQDEVLQRIWQQAEESLRGLRDASQRLGILERLFCDAAQQLQASPLEIQVNGEDLKLIDNDVLTRWQARLDEAGLGAVELRLAVQVAPIWGGVIVRHADSHRLVDNSFNARLALAKSRLRDEVYHLLSHAQGAEE